MRHFLPRKYGQRAQLSAALKKILHSRSRSLLFKFMRSRYKRKLSAERERILRSLPSMAATNIRAAETSNRKRAKTIHL
jgi:hypothetical protein